MGYPFALSLRRTESESRISRNKKFFEIIIIWPCREEVISPPLQGGVLGALPSWATNNLKYFTSLLSSIGRAADLIQDDPLRRIGLT